MPQATLQKMYNKELEKMDVMPGNVFSNLQSSIYVRSISARKCNGHDFATGELFTSDLQNIEKWQRYSRFPDSFYTKLHEVCNEDSACVYVFHNPAGSASLSFAIGTKEGLQYFHEVGTTEKQRSINAYIRETMDEKGWY